MELPLDVCRYCTRNDIPLSVGLTYDRNSQRFLYVIESLPPGTVKPVLAQMSKAWTKIKGCWHYTAQEPLPIHEHDLIAEFAQLIE